MPVSSNQVAQMMAGQHASAIAGVNQYAQQMQSPIAALNQAQFAGNTSSMGAASIAPSVIGAGVGVGSALNTAGMMAGAMGFAPRQLDPFSNMWQAGRMGMQSAGAAGAIGNVALLGGAYLAMGQAASFATQNIIQGAQQQTHMMNAIQSGYAGSGMQMGNMGVGLSAQLSNVGLGMSDAAVGTSLQGSINPGSMTGLISQGMSSGQFRGVRSVNQFRQKLAQYTAEAARMADMLKVSIDQAAAQMDQISGQFGMGGGAATGMIAGMAGATSATGMSIQAQMAGAASGAQVFQGLGMSRAGGASYGLGLHQRLGAGLQSGALSKRVIGDLGGIDTVSAGFTRGGLRGLSSVQGMRILGASMGADGTLDRGIASKIASGMMSRQEINKLYHQNVKGIGGRRNLLAARGELMGQFMSEFGPEGVMGGLGSMFEGRAGAGFLMQQATGLGNSELGALGDLGASRDKIRMKIAEAARQGLRSGGQRLSIPAALQKGLDQALGPIRNKFQQYGRDINQAIAGTIEDISRDLAGKGPAGISGDISAGVSAAAMGNVGLAQRLGYGGYGSTGGSGIISQAYGAQTGIGSLVNSMTPGIVGHLQAGGSLGGAGGLPGYGLGAPGMPGAVFGGLAGVGAMGAVGSTMGHGMLGASGWLAARAGPMSGFMGLAGRGLGGGMVGAARAGTWMGGQALRAGAGMSRFAMGAMGGPLGMALMAAGQAGMTAAEYGGQFGASSGIMGKQADAVMLAEQAGLVNLEYTNMHSGSANFLQRQGYAPVVGATKGESGIMQDFAHFVGAGGTASQGVQQGFIGADGMSSIRAFLSGGINDTSDLENSTGMSRKGLTTMATSVMAEAHRNISSAGGTENFNYFDQLRSNIQAAGKGYGLKNISRMDVLRLAHIGGGDAELTKMMNGIGATAFANMSKQQFNASMSSQLELGFGRFKKRMKGSSVGYKHSVAEAVNGKVRVRDLADRSDAFDGALNRVRELTEGFKRGADTSSLMGMGRADSDSLDALRKHVREGVATESGEFKAIVNDMINSESFGDFAATGAAFAGRWKAAAGTRALIKRRQESADSYTKYVGKSGVDLEGLLSGTNIRGASELGNKLKSMMSEYAQGDADPSKDSSNREAIRRLLSKMDPDEAHDISSALQSYADSSGSPAIQEFAMMARSNSNFRGRYKKELRRPGNTGNKLKTISGMFGGTSGIKRALGLSGSKEHRKYIREYMRNNDGDLPPSAKIALLGARRADLAASGMSAGLAGDEMKEMGRFLDAKGIEKEDVPYATKIAETSARMGASGAKRPGGAAGGGAHQNYTEAVGDFTRKLGEAGAALEAFSGKIGATKGANGTNEGPQNTGIWDSLTSMFD